MRSHSYLFLLLLLGCLSCSSGLTAVPQAGISDDGLPIINPEGDCIATRFRTPATYSRIPADSLSFAHYLRNLPLKEDGAQVMYYDGSIKSKRGVYDAVIDLKIGKRNLHQCADAVMRLRAEYLYSLGKYDQIHFNFTNGFRADYSEWIKGKRIGIEGNKTWWKSSASAGNNADIFWSYLETVFTYAGTLSLSAELKTRECSDMQIGDVFIRGGSPGHAVIIVDMAEDSSGRKLFMLAQSYMPAQELQVLKNPKNSSISPWYDQNFGDELYTPEWTFTRNELKHFE